MGQLISRIFKGIFGERENFLFTLEVEAFSGSRLLEIMFICINVPEKCKLTVWKESIVVYNRLHSLDWTFYHATEKKENFENLTVEKVREFIVFET